MKKSLTLMVAAPAAMVVASGITLADVDRAIPLEGVLNTRDLGGLKTADGRRVRKELLIRSGSIDGISEAGKAKLDDIDVVAIIDLRTTAEAGEDPTAWPEGEGPARYNFPVMEQENQMIADMRRSIKTGTATAAGTDKLFFDAFGYIPSDYTKELRQFFDVLIATTEGAVLYHCSGGKDRTGVATALLLEALGVTREDIKADFLLSNALKDSDNKSVEVAAKVNAKFGTDMTPEAVWPSLGVRPEYLENFYTTVDQQYGSVNQYLREALGLTEADLETLRSRYLEG